MSIFIGDFKIVNSDITLMSQASSQLVNIRYGIVTANYLLNVTFPGVISQLITIITNL